MEDHRMSKSEGIQETPAEDTYVPYYLLLSRELGDERWVILGGWRDMAIAYRRLRQMCAVLWEPDYKIVEARELDWTELK